MTVPELLPAGMIGIIISAMFSATMATVSADFNSMASVLTKDIYHRLINPRAEESSLVRMGRLITLALGALTILLGVWIAISHQQSLFHLMVTVFGLLIAPTLLPLLAGLTMRGLTRKGALAGFLVGLAVGILTLTLKMWWLPSIQGLPPEWANFTFEGISILINTAATILAMRLGSVYFSTDEEEQARICRFFVALDRPVARSEVRKTVSSPLRAIGVATVGVGVLLAAAGLLSHSFASRAMDLAVGAGLIALGIAYVYKGNPGGETA